MCIKNIIAKRIFTLVLLCMVMNVACDFSAFNFNSTFTNSKEIDLDNTYLESLLEGVFHKDIKMTNQNAANKQTSSVFVFKLCPVVAFHEQPAVLLPLNTTSIKGDYFQLQQKIYPQSFIEINSPPPQA